MYINSNDNDGVCLLDAIAYIVMYADDISKDQTQILISLKFISVDGT